MSLLISKSSNRINRFGKFRSKSYKSYEKDYRTDTSDLSSLSLTQAFLLTAKSFLSSCFGNTITNANLPGFLPYTRTTTPEPRATRVSHRACIVLPTSSDG